VRGVEVGAGEVDLPDRWRDRAIGHLTRLIGAPPPEIDVILCSHVPAPLNKAVVRVMTNRHDTRT
jgi:hypothetical protein